ncbi:hypothetical protein QF034_000229 [Streptomyces africanus]|uniref:Uncharacterized protein n=1 Tax=Streptomyces africanus TaxID=231024 RepID=A0ABU0QF34_9ACTN|nr:hypothetical protein [Streptomyces africanus]MDQ0745998.1 hypothetical protein [Streptomyces africanus]
MAMERTSRPGVTDSAGKADSLGPEAFTVEARLSLTAGARVGE